MEVDASKRRTAPQKDKDTDAKSNNMAPPRFLPGVTTLNTQALKEAAEKTTAETKKVQALFASENGEVTIPLTADAAEAEKVVDQEAVEGVVAAVYTAKETLKERWAAHNAAKSQLAKAEALADTVTAPGTAGDGVAGLTSLLQSHGRAHADLKEARARIQVLEEEKQSLADKMEATQSEVRSLRDRETKTAEELLALVSKAQAAEDEAAALGRELQESQRREEASKNEDQDARAKLHEVEAREDRAARDARDREADMDRRLQDARTRENGLQNELREVEAREIQAARDARARESALQSKLREVEVSQAQAARDAQAREAALQEKLRGALDGQAQAARDGQGREAALQERLREAQAGEDGLRRELGDSNTRLESALRAGRDAQSLAQTRGDSLAEAQAREARLQRDLQVSRAAIEQLEGDLMQAGINDEDFANRIGALERLVKALGVDPSMKLGRIVDGPTTPRARAPRSAVWKVFPAWLGSDGETGEVGVLEPKEALIRLQTAVGNNDLVSSKPLSLLALLTSAVATAPAIEAEALGKLLEDASGRMAGASAADSAAIYAWWQLAWLFTQGWEDQSGVDGVMAGHLVSPFDTLSEASKDDRLWEAAQKLGHVFQHIVLPPVDALHVVLVDARTKSLRVLARSQMVTTIMEGTIVAPEGTGNVLVELGHGNLAPWIEVVEARDLSAAPSA